MTVDEWLTKFKDFADIKATHDTGEGNMFRYQQTYMDEKDLAEHEFRERTNTGKSLNEFT